MYNGKILQKKPSYTKKTFNALKLKSSQSPTDFVSYLLNAGNEFEKKVVALMYKKYPAGTIIDIGGDHGCVSKDKYGFRSHRGLGDGRAALSLALVYLENDLPDLQLVAGLDQ